MSDTIDQGMILAAGQGVRMRPLTLTTPKPLLKVGGISMLDRLLKTFQICDVNKIIINTCYLGDKIRQHVQGLSGVATSTEDICLETGGGVLNVLNFFQDKPFFVANGDVAVVTPLLPVFTQLQAAWDDLTMDALLLLVPRSKAWGYEGAGDYFMEGIGTQITYRGDRDSAPYIYGGVQIFHPRAFSGFSPGIFSSVKVFHAAQKAGRLHGVVLAGDWYHFGTPEALQAGQNFFEP